ncbi:MAG: GrpB family protein, partial [Bacteroidales bacterium]|nr:GrpB family protein [Bacteroidales bacterium]
HTHVRIIGRANQRYPILFRDYLRTHTATAQSYAELKLRLATHLADPEMYPEVKDPAVDLIFFAAEAWAEATAWQPGPSDA